MSSLSYFEHMLFESMLKDLCLQNVTFLNILEALTRKHFKTEGHLFSFFSLKFSVF